LYREAGSKEERREIKKRIVEEKALKSYLNHGGKKVFTPAGKGK
jgi:hypothetical protein